MFSNYLLLIVMLFSVIANVNSFTTNGLKSTNNIRLRNHHTYSSFNILKSSASPSVDSNKGENILLPKVPIHHKKNGLTYNFKKYLLPTLLTLGVAIFGFQYSASASTFSETIASLTKTANDSGFVQSFLLIFISEIGDKTFFIAALLAAKYGKIIAFLGSISALGVMTIISTVIGQLFHAVPSSISQGIPFDDYIAIAAFSYFGIKTLYDSSKMSMDDNSGMFAASLDQFTLHITTCLYTICSQLLLTSKA